MFNKSIPSKIVPDGFGCSEGDRVETVVNTLTECGLSRQRAQQLVIEHGPMGALSAAKDEKDWSHS